jgi:hypothetical protein
MFPEASACDRSLLTSWGWSSPSLSLKPKEEAGPGMSGLDGDRSFPTHLQAACSFLLSVYEC